MSEFNSRTSGSVTLPDGRVFTWETLPNDFVRGYIEALREGLSVDLIVEWLEYVDPFCTPGFSHLSREALARILKDCRRFAEAYGEPAVAVSGLHFWTVRQRGEYAAFPPLVPFIHDGKVQLREATTCAQA